MASIIFNSLMPDLFNGDVQFDADTFYMMLTTSAYTPDKAHNRRDDITNEVVGAGYAAGGKAVTFVATPGVNVYDQVMNDVSWAAATITARYAVIYKRRGGAASADELVACIDFGADKSSVADTFLVKATSPLRMSNP